MNKQVKELSERIYHILYTFSLDKQATLIPDSIKEILDTIDRNSFTKLLVYTLKQYDSDYFVLFMFACVDSGYYENISYRSLKNILVKIADDQTALYTFISFFFQYLDSNLSKETVILDKGLSASFTNELFPVRSGAVLYKQLLHYHLDTSVSAFDNFSQKLLDEGAGRRERIIYSETEEQIESYRIIYREMRLDFKYSRVSKFSGLFRSALGMLFTEQDQELLELVHQAAIAGVESSYFPDPKVPFDVWVLEKLKDADEWHLPYILDVVGHTKNPSYSKWIDTYATHVNPAISNAAKRALDRLTVYLISDKIMS
ncbi:hypothetical protein [Xanthocytophaga agilis]|uniref:Uncharacterized protein n=1 Tax=Xanthocytophaga agilis TaxID=3048010 RepID=A0AAE3UCT9_9BACT|nr:hypothetical protein [Xanthocytophaga agilis]MDJ1501208.1 hypothetical protein [Xanthocytophaga agilis]